MPRFEALRSKRNPNHVAVRDNTRNRILHLTTPRDPADDSVNVNEDTDVAESNRIWEWEVDPKFQYSDSDDQVVDRWNRAIAYVATKQPKYDITGDFEHGVNCENLVIFVLENRLAADKGNIARMIRNLLGFDPQTGASGLPWSSADPGMRD